MPTGQTDKQTDGSHTVTLRFPLDGASVKISKDVMPSDLQVVLPILVVAYLTPANEYMP